MTFNGVVSIKINMDKRDMKIIRAEINDKDIFSEEELKYGACCFFTEDRSNKYFFKIKGQESILYTSSKIYIDEAIDEFLFYSGFITLIKNSEGNILKERKIDMYLLKISEIQPSQFYINEKKLANCKQWIIEQRDIMIPISTMDGKTVSLDGHTRLRAALDLGYDSVYVYNEACDDYICYFVEEAIKRKVFSVYDMDIVDDEEYKLKWHKFCNEFLKFNN